MELKEGDKVDLVIGKQTDLGYTVFVDENYEGLLYNNEIYEDIEEGLKLKGYIKKIREDNKLDVSLRQQGFKNVIDKDVQIILDKLKVNKFILLTDKSSPESIKFHLQMSKKAFKRAVGSLYKSKQIKIEQDRIVLVQS